MSEKKQSPHQFKQGIDLIHPIGNIGDISVHTVKRSVEQADENYYMGMQETKRYTTPVMDALAVVGAKEMVKSIQAEFNQITITSNHVHSLINEGKLSMVDLADKKQLHSRLGEIKEISRFQRHQINKYRETAYELLIVKDAIEKKKAVADKLEPTLKKHMKSSDFFDLQKQKTNELLKIYFKTSGNDVLKNVNPAGMNEKTLKKLLNSAKKNGFTESDIAAIRLAGKQVKYRNSRIHVGKLLNIRKHVELLRYGAERIQGATSEGIRQIAATVQILYGAFAVGKFGLKAGIVTGSFAAKYTGVTFLLHKINLLRKEKTAELKKRVGEAIKSTKSYQTAAKRKEALKKSVSDTKKKITDALDQKSSVQKYKKAQKEIGNKAKSAAQKVNRTRAAAKAAGRKVKQGADIVFSPLRLVGKIFGKIGSMINGINVGIMAVIGIAIAVFICVVVLTNSILSICETESTVALTAILAEDENFISDMNATLQRKSSDKRAEAEDIINGQPLAPDVLEGHTISRYGYPDASGNYVGGSKVIYLDGAGNVILNGMNNIKDCIGMAYVIMGGDFDTNSRARDELIENLWELMNPSVTYRESDIYTCPNGCDTLSYYCNDSSDYTTIQSYKDAGVGFYDTIKTYSEYGDSYTVTCDGCLDDEGNEITHSAKTGTGVASAPTGCTNYTIEYDCDGHSVGVCYGHKDVEVYITVKMLEEMLQSGELPNGTGKSYQGYLSDFTGWDEDNSEWVRLLVNTDWYELYGVDPSGGTGFVAGSGMTPEEIAAILDTYGDIDTARSALCADAMSFVGQIPYYWGGKASAKDYTANGFNATVTPDERGRNKKGLDCSGFVQWIIWRNTDVRLGGSTATITAGMEQITASELQPGDLGLMASPGAASNHVGIFVGYDAYGQALWCHENSGSGNVAVNNTTCFRLYYKVY